MRSVLLFLLHSGLSFLLASFLWVTGNIDFHEYVAYKGLLALVVDYWREFVMVVLPLSLLSGWRGVVMAQKMYRNKTKGLRIMFDVALIMTALGILFNTVNLYYYGPYQTFSSKTSDYLHFAPAMFLDKLIVGGIFGVLIGLAIFVVNLAGHRLLLSSVDRKAV